MRSSVSAAVLIPLHLSSLQFHLYVAQSRAGTNVYKRIKRTVHFTFAPLFSSLFFLHSPLCPFLSSSVGFAAGPMKWLLWDSSKRCRVKVIGEFRTGQRCSKCLHLFPPASTGPTGSDCARSNTAGDSSPPTSDLVEPRRKRGEEYPADLSA
jgi:hypothetical protein